MVSQLLWSEINYAGISGKGFLYAAVLEIITDKQSYAADGCKTQNNKATIKHPQDLNGRLTTTGCWCW